MLRDLHNRLDAWLDRLDDWLRGGRPVPPPVETSECRVIRVTEAFGAADFFYLGEAFLIDGIVRFVSDPVALGGESFDALDYLVGEVIGAMMRPQVHLELDGTLREVP